MAVVAIMVLMVNPTVVSAQGKSKKAEIKTETFKVYGACGMCKKRIEAAARGKGVSQVNWDQQSLMFTVTFDAAKTNLEQIEERIVKAGHDTDTRITDQKTYDNLHHCCKYERNSKVFEKESDTDDTKRIERPGSSPSRQTETPSVK